MTQAASAATVQVRPLIAPGVRIGSVDAYRGLVMLLMLAEVLRTCSVSAAVPWSGFWALFCYEQTHVAWVGASLHDLIQPSFCFLVGVALIISISRRHSAGQKSGTLVRHAVFRSVVLVMLGMLLVSTHPRQWMWYFYDTLTQIGLAYPWVFITALRPRRDWYTVLGLILVGYWVWFALSPLPPQNFDYAKVGVSAEWMRLHGLSGFAAHWQKNVNPAAVLDRRFLSLFPADRVYNDTETGLTTLNFIPSIGTMILGLFAGSSMKRTEDSGWHKFRSLVATGLLLLCGGWLLGVSGVCPVVKAIWTPSWVLFSGGWCFLMLAAFYALVDLLQLGRLVFPLTVIGMNAIVAYTLYHVYPAFAFNSLRRVLGERIFLVLGSAYEPMLYGVAILLAYWLVLYVLYRQRIFVRI